MNKSILIAIACCVIPLAIIGFIFLSGGERVDHSTMPGWTDKNKVRIGTSIGDSAPDFQLVDIGGTKITKSEFNKKPMIVWFTASYCVPCQIGAKEVARLDSDLGDGTFDVVMVFIDPRETEQDLRWWKDNFANKDWLIAFGDEKIIGDYKIRFLDTQYLLDRDGVIQNLANSNVGYEAYKSKIQSLIQ